MQQVAEQADGGLLQEGDRSPAAVAKHPSYQKIPAAWKWEASGNQSICVESKEDIRGSSWNFITCKHEMLEPTQTRPNQAGKKRLLNLCF